jgi:hypothetical protein
LASRIAAVVAMASLGGANRLGGGCVRTTAVEPCESSGFYSNLTLTLGTPGYAMVLPGIPGVKPHIEMIDRMAKT